MLVVTFIVIAFGFVLFLVGYVIIGVISRRRCITETKMLKSQISTQLQSSHLIGSHPEAMAVGTQNPGATNILRSESQYTGLTRSSWSRHWRTLVSLSFLLLFLVSLFAVNNLSDGTIQHLVSNAISLSRQQASAQDLSLTAQPPAQTASQRLARISQLDSNQYSSSAEYQTWAYSACSAAAMTEVFNAYGRHFRVTDVLQLEAQIGEITADQGLVKPEGIEHTAAQFGFKTTWGKDWTLDNLLFIANAGSPIIVGFPPDRYAGGHILVLTGGDSEKVFLADTSLWNRHVISRAQFLQWWGGFAAIVRPA